MASRRSFPLVILTFVALAGGAAGLNALRSEPNLATTRFDAHQFALFRSSYDTLRTQSSEVRNEHFQKLVEASEVASLTPGMILNLQGFCRDVLASHEESEDVKAQARMVLHALERRQAARDFASVR